MATVNLTQYTLQDFNNIIWGGFAYDLKDSGVIELISSLADKVGAPSYIKTPVFPKREKPSNASSVSSVSSSSSSNSASGNSRRSKNKPSQITDDDWNGIRNFQKTEIKKTEGIEKHIDTIRALLNKLTDATFNEIKVEILNEIKGIVSGIDNSDNDGGDNDGGNNDNAIYEENITKIAVSVFHTASSNVFYSALYSKLFKEFMSYNEIFTTVFEKSFYTFVGLFKKIDYIEPSVDYNKFCENTKLNDKRKAMSTFIINLMKEGVLHPDKVVDIILELQEMITSYIKHANKTNELEELNENVFILVTNGKDILSKHEEWERIVSKIKFLSILKAKMKEYPSVNNKLIFKNMDILEELNLD